MGPFSKRNTYFAFIYSKPSLYQTWNSNELNYKIITLRNYCIYSYFSLFFSVNFFFQRRQDDDNNKGSTAGIFYYDRCRDTDGPLFFTLVLPETWVA